MNIKDSAAAERKHSDRTERYGLRYTPNLWWLTYSPLCWAAHFLASYLTAAIYCAKGGSADGDALPVRIAVAIFTIIALSLIASVGRRSLRVHCVGQATLPHDDDTLLDEQRFLGFAALLLSLLSGIATLYTALVFVFMETCH
ncbi:hypothetical protein FF011L_15870 [Roseimaritima multifibrata]|uniref:Uncharacterized protein n=1 Tax=Roseimaritima multifibrata TaxID=1930274 RepID=A0A517MD78_9BACT|nr:transmembrane prediction [Roseimaritima multifibrata]QDS92838.1 hypothetical protein FF011L_15870 [Roseimaritima multifibrata]